MIMTKDHIKALSLECLPPRTVKNSPHNHDIIKKIDVLDVEYKATCTKVERVKILARVYELCLMLDVIWWDWEHCILICSEVTFLNMFTFGKYREPISALFFLIRFQILANLNFESFWSYEKRNLYILL